MPGNFKIKKIEKNALNKFKDQNKILKKFGKKGILLYKAIGDDPIDASFVLETTDVSEEEFAKILEFMKENEMIEIIGSEEELKKYSVPKVLQKSEEKLNVVEQPTEEPQEPQQEPTIASEQPTEQPTEPEIPSEEPQREQTIAPDEEPEPIEQPTEQPEIAPASTEQVAQEQDTTNELIEKANSISNKIKDIASKVNEEQEQEHNEDIEFEPLDKEEQQEPTIAPEQQEPEPTIAPNEEPTEQPAEEPQEPQQEPTIAPEQPTEEQEPEIEPEISSEELQQEPTIAPEQQEPEPAIAPNEEPTEQPAIAEPEPSIAPEQQESIEEQEEKSPMDKILDAYGEQGLKVYSLIDGKKSVDEIAKEVGTTQEKVIEMLDFMEKEGIVKMEKPLDSEPVENIYNPMIADEGELLNKEEELIIPEKTKDNLVKNIKLKASLMLKFGDMGSAVYDLIDGKRNIIDIMSKAQIPLKKIEEIIQFLLKEKAIKTSNMSRADIRKRFGEDGYIIYKKYGKAGLALYEMVGTDKELKDMARLIGEKPEKIADMFIFIHKVLGIELPVDREMIIKQISS